MTIRKLLSASALIAFGMLAGRMLGFLREMLLAAQFGAGSEANVAIALLLIPDFITSLLIGSALSNVLIPAFAERDKEQALALFWQSLWLFVGGFSVLTVGLGFFTSSFIAIALYSLPLTAATGVFTAYLQHRGRLLVPAFTTVIFNSIILGALWFLPPGLLMLAFAVIFASFARLAASFVAYLRAGGSGKNIFPKKWELNKNLFVAYSQTIATNMLGIFILYTPFAIVALLSLEGFAQFNYAFKLLTFPAVVIQTVIQMVLLPWFVSNIKLRSSNKPLQLALVVLLIISIVVTFASDFIAQICFGYGKITAGDVAEIGKLLAIGIWVTPSMVVLSVLQQMFYAHKKPKPVLIANIVLLLFIVPLCWIGQIMGGSEGMLVGFVVAQVIPVAILAIMKRDIS